MSTPSRTLWLRILPSCLLIIGGLTAWGLWELRPNPHHNQKSSSRNDADSENGQISSLALRGAKSFTMNNTYWDNNKICLAGLKAYFFLKQTPKVISQSNKNILVESQLGNRYACAVSDSKLHFSWKNKSGEKMTSNSTTYSVRDGKLTVSTGTHTEIFEVKDLETSTSNSSKRFKSLPQPVMKTQIPIEDHSNILETREFPRKKLIGLIDPAVDIIRAKGMKCSSITSMRPLLMSSGFEMICNNYAHRYTFKNKGGRWLVSVK